jgi:hypothetical protein
MTIQAVQRILFNSSSVIKSYSGDKKIREKSEFQVRENLPDKFDDHDNLRHEDYVILKLNENLLQKKMVNKHNESIVKNERCFL